MEKTIKKLDNVIEKLKLEVQKSEEYKLTYSQQKKLSEWQSINEFIIACFYYSGIDSLFYVNRITRQYISTNVAELKKTSKKEKEQITKQFQDKINQCTFNDQIFDKLFDTKRYQRRKDRLKVVTGVINAEENVTYVEEETEERYFNLFKMLANLCVDVMLENENSENSFRTIGTTMVQIIKEDYLSRNTQLDYLNHNSIKAWANDQNETYNDLKEQIISFSNRFPYDEIIEMKNKGHKYEKLIEMREEMIKINKIIKNE